MTEFEAFTVESANSHIARVRDKMLSTQDKVPERKNKLRIPLLMLASDRKIVLQGVPLVQDDDTVDRLVLPVKSAVHLGSNDTFDSILTEHLDDHMLLAHRQVPYRLFSFGNYRTFSSDNGDVPVDVTTIPGVALFGCASNEVGFRYRYQEKYGELSWFTLDKAVETLQEKAQAVDASKAILESLVLVETINTQIKGHHGAHSRAI